MLLQYLFVYSFMVFLVPFGKEVQIRFFKYCLDFFVTVLFALVIITVTNSIDYMGYNVMYNEVKSLTNYNTDIGFNFLILIHRNIFNNFESFYRLIGIINVILICYIIERFQTVKDKIVFLAAYASFFLIQKNLIQIRNALALNLFLVGVSQLFKGKKTKFYLIYILSCAIHNSILVFIPVIMFRKIKVRKAFVIILFILFFVSYKIFPGALRDSVSSILPSSNFRVISYMGFDLDNLSIFHFYKLCVYFILFNIFSDKNNPKVRFFFWCIIYAYIFRIIICDFSFLTSRLAENLYIGEPFLFVYMFRKIKNKNQLIIKSVFLWLYCAINLHMQLKNLKYLHAYESFISF